MSNSHLRDPQRFARESLWKSFNDRAGAFTKFLTDNDPERTRLYLENSNEVTIEAWVSDFENNVSVLYKMADHTWVLYTHWRETSDPCVCGPVAFVAISATSLESVAKAVALLESHRNGEVVGITENDLHDAEGNCDEK